MDEIVKDQTIIERKILHMGSNTERFVKIYKKETFKEMPHLKQMLLNEYKCLSKLDHPNIIKIRDFYEEPKFLFAVYDYFGEGTLKEYVESMENYNETHVYYILIQVARALDHAHEHGVCHRDLRPGVIRMNNLQSKFFPTAILAGFQNAGFFLKENDCSFSNFLNKNLEYCAPEMIKNKTYSEKCDIWSFGILAYTMLCGHPPFTGKSSSDLKLKITKGKYKFIEREWENKSEPAMNLIKDCLNTNPKKRPTANKLLDHSWFNRMKQRESTKTAIRRVMVKDMTDTLQNLDMMNYLQKSFLKFIYENMASDDTSLALRKEFEKLDFDGKKMLPSDQIMEIYKRYAKESVKAEEKDQPEEEEKKNLLDGPDEEVKTLSDDDQEETGLKELKSHSTIQKKDQEGDQTTNLNLFMGEKDLKRLVGKLEKDGFVNYEAFIAHLGGASNTKAEKVLRMTFEKLDSNGDGTVTSEELKKLLLQSGSMNKQEQSFFKQIMTEMDTHMEKKMTYAEFKALMQSLLVAPNSQK